MEASVIKRGETCIQIKLARIATGLSVEVKTHPRVEDFFRGLGNGQVVEVGAIGRHWTPKAGVDGAPRPFTVYTIPPLDLPRSEDGLYLNLSQAGHPLLMGSNTPNDTVNLSPLRLVGASEGSGVAFSIKGVYSLEALRKLRDHLSLATKRFYVDFLRPVELSVTVSTQEIQY